MRESSLSFKAANLAAALVLGLALVLAQGCGMFGPKPKVQVSEPKPSAPATPEEVARAADKAYMARDWEQAELYYSRLLEKGAPRGFDRLEATKRLAESAYRSGHLRQAQIALEDWAQIDAGARALPQWQSMYLDVLGRLEKSVRLREHILITQGSPELPWAAKLKAAQTLMDLPYDPDFAANDLSDLAAFHDRGATEQERAELETAYAERLAAMSPERLAELGELVDSDNESRFPYALIALESAVRRVEGDPEIWSGVWRRMRRILSAGTLATDAVWREKLAELEAEYGVPKLGVALALPLSGRYAPFAWKVLKGAGMAQWALAQNGTDMEVMVVNTEDGQWSRRIGELPDYVGVVGGPLRQSALAEALRADLLSQRSFFVFRSGLGDIAEGNGTWRFFPSPEDQVKALVNMAVDGLDMDRLGVLYPREHFGRRMAKVFADQAHASGAEIAALDSYPPGDVPAWGRVVADFLKAPEDADKEVKADPDFGAVFLPDSWSQAQLLVPQLFFFEEDRLVLLGPEAWCQALAGSRDVDVRYFSLAVCPGAWWGGSRGGELLAGLSDAEGVGEPDFWVALGFDFVRFAANLGTVAAGTAPLEVNARIAQAQDMLFALAPIKWDDQGRASEDLYLFQPASQGLRILDINLFKARLDRAVEKRKAYNEAKQQRIDEAESRASEEAEGGKPATGQGTDLLQ